MTKFQRLYEASKLGTFFILVIPTETPKSSQTVPCIFLIKLTKQIVILFLNYY